MTRPRDDARLRGFAYVAIAAVCWGLWPLFLRPAGVPGAVSGGIAALILAVAGLPVQWRGRGRRRSLAGWVWMGVAGLLDAGNMGLYFSALGHGSIAAAVLSHYLAPVLAPALAWLVLREWISARTPLAAALGLGGLALVLLPTAGKGSATAALLGAASAVFYGALFPVGKRLTREFSAWEVQSWHSWLTAAVLFSLAPPTGLALRPLALVALGSVLCALFAGLLFYRGLALAPAGQASVLTYLEPLSATAVGALAFHEPLGPLALAGAALIVGGGLVVALEPQAAVGAAAGTA